MSLVQLRSPKATAAVAVKTTVPVQPRLAGPPLRIVMVIPYDVEKQPFTIRTHRYAQELVDRGHHVEVYYWGKKDGVVVHAKLPSSVQYTRVRFRYVSTLKQLLDAVQNADVVHFQKSLMHSSIPAVAFAKWFGKPLYQDWDDYESFFWLQTVRDRLAQRAPVTKVLGAMARLVTTTTAEWLIPKVSDTIGTSASELRFRSVKWGAEPGMIFPARVGVDIEDFGPHRRDEQLRNQLGLTGYKAVLLSGSFDLEPDLRFFADSLTHLFASTKDAKAWIVGGGFGRKRLVELVAERGLRDRVVFTNDFVPFADMPRYVASADIAALPFRDNEVNRAKSSLTLLECMASGLPVVTHDVGDVRWTMGEGGIIAPHGDPNAYAGELARLCASDEARQTMGAAGRKRVTEEFQWSRVVDGVEDAYRAAIRKHRRTHG